MKKLSFALVGAAALALAACGGKGDDASATTSQDNYEDAADNLEAAADNTANAAEADAWRTRPTRCRKKARTRKRRSTKPTSTRQAVNAM